MLPGVRVLDKISIPSSGYHLLSPNVPGFRHFAAAVSLEGLHGCQHWQLSGGEQGTQERGQVPRPGLLEQVSWVCSGFPSQVCGYR